MKYHKNIYFKPQDIDKLKILNSQFKSKRFVWSVHAKEQLCQRMIDIKYFYNWFNNICFSTDNIIEYTIVNNDIKKVLYRFNYDNKKDVCISISKSGYIITIWFNNRSDSHNTLNINEYAVS